MGLFSKGKKAKFREIPLSASQKEADKLLQGLVTEDVTIPEQQIAPLSELERVGIGKIGELGGIDTGALGQSAADVLEKTLAGDFDPRTSPFFQGFRQEAQRLKGEAISDVQRRSQRLTGAPAGTALRQTGEVGARADESILQVLGQLFETERARQFSAVPQAFNTISGISSLLAGAGRSERSVEQDVLNAQFAQQAGDINFRFGRQAELAQQLLQQQRFTFTPGVQGSNTFQDIAGIAGIVTGASALGGLGGLGGTGGGTGIGAGGAGGLFGGIQSFLSGGGASNAGGTSFFDLNTGMPGIPVGNTNPFSVFA